MNNKKNIVLVAAVITALFLVWARGAFMRMNYLSYKGDRLSFEYPKDWTLRESTGTKEKYFQVHVFGVPDKEAGFGPSVTLTVYPKKGLGMALGSRAAMSQQYLAVAKKLKGYTLIQDKVTSLNKAVVSARDTEAVFSARLPLYKTTAKDVAMQERTLFFERGPDIYVLSYKNLKTGFLASSKVFERVLATLRFTS
ncbi:MAG: hypothetical protein AAB213_03255 [Candidatus Omnitrophota bacterium]